MSLYKFSWLFRTVPVGRLSRWILRNMAQECGAFDEMCALVTFKTVTPWGWPSAHGMIGWAISRPCTLLSSRKPCQPLGLMQPPSSLVHREESAESIEWELREGSFFSLLKSCICLESTGPEVYQRSACPEAVPFVHGNTVPCRLFVLHLWHVRGCWGSKRFCSWFHCFPLTS